MYFPTSKRGLVWIRIFLMFNTKPAEVRQGKGKGAVEFWQQKSNLAKYFEIDGVNKDLAEEDY